MGLLGSGVFWGVVLVLIGLSIIVKTTLNINVPVFRITLALLLIYLGARVLLGGRWWHTSPAATTVFSSVRTAALNGQREYNVVFGKATIDASDPALTDRNRFAKVTTAFGASHVIISSAVPTVVKVEAAFAGARMPDGSTVSFGDYVYRNKAAREQAEAADLRCIEISVAFGECVIEER